MITSPIIAGDDGAVDEVDDVTSQAAPIYDEENLEKCLAFAGINHPLYTLVVFNCINRCYPLLLFLDAKKKLRLVLSTSSLSSLVLLSRYKLHGASHLTDNTAPNFLVCYLRVMLAEANLHQNLQLVTQVQEAIRCLQRFSDNR